MFRWLYGSNLRQIITNRNVENCFCLMANKCKFPQKQMRILLVEEPALRSCNKVRLIQLFLLLLFELANKAILALASSLPTPKGIATAAKICQLLSEDT